MTLTKADLSDQLYEKVGLNNREAKEMVEAFFMEITDSLARGNEVKLSGFGGFKLLQKPERPGRNAKTGKEIPVAARCVVSFIASGKLKSAVDASPNPKHKIRHNDVSPLE
jgi:integration host factor subunit alpha